MRKTYIQLSLLALSAPSLAMALGYADYMQSENNPRARYYYNAPTPQDYGPSPQEGYYDPWTHRLDGGYYYYAPQNVRPGYPNSNTPSSANADGYFYYNQPSGQGQFTQTQTPVFSGGIARDNFATSGNVYYSVPSNTTDNAVTAPSNSFFFSQPSQASAQTSTTPSPSSGNNSFFYTQPSQVNTQTSTTPSFSSSNATAFSDSELRNRITTILNNFPNARNITVTVDSGFVTLTGPINSTTDRDVIKARILQLEGIRNVSFNPNSNTNPISALDVNSMRNATTTDSTRRPVVQDGAIAQRVREVLKKGLLNKGFEEIKVTKVYNGTVFIKGTVDTKKDLSEIKTRIHSVPGVEAIDDTEITISPTA